MSETTFEQTQNISGQGRGHQTVKASLSLLSLSKATAFFFFFFFLFFCDTPKTSLAGTDENEAALVSARH